MDWKEHVNRSQQFAGSGAWDAGVSHPNPRARLHLFALVLMPTTDEKHLLCESCHVGELISSFPPLPFATSEVTPTSGSWNVT